MNVVLCAFLIHRKMYTDLNGQNVYLPHDSYPIRDTSHAVAYACYWEDTFEFPHSSTSETEEINYKTSESSLRWQLFNKRCHDIQYSVFNV